MAFAGRIARINDGTGRSWFPIGHVLKNVARQGLRDWIAFGSPGDIYLTEQNHSAAFAVFQQRAVLKAVAAVNDREKISTRRFLDQHGSNVAAIATAPEVRHGNIAPIHRWAVARPKNVIETRWENRGVAAPVPQMLDVESREQRMAGHGREYLSQAVLGHAKTKTLYENVRGLFKHQHLESNAHTSDVRRGSVCRQRGLADNENVEFRKRIACIDALKFHADSIHCVRRFALRIEQCDAAIHFRSRWTRENGNGEGIGLHLAVAESEVRFQFSLTRRHHIDHHDVQRNSLLLARGDGDLLSPAIEFRIIQRPCGFARHRFTRVVDHDELLLDRFAGKEDVVLAREVLGLAGNVSEQQTIITQERTRGGSWNPVITIKREVPAVVGFIHEVG